jgi:hypothetical protein
MRVLLTAVSVLLFGLRGLPYDVRLGAGVAGWMTGTGLADLLR